MYVMLQFVLLNHYKLFCTENIILNSYNNTSLVRVKNKRDLMVICIVTNCLLVTLVYFSNFSEI